MDQKNIAAFYDEFSRRLLKDYVYGNPRIEAAIELAQIWIPVDAKRVLDIGCGIGWSSWELVRLRPHATVTGLDISPRTIQLANALFDGDRMEFMAGDITNGSLKLASRFDAIVMIDVYEHIEKSKRQDLHVKLKALANPRSVIVITCPSTFHQDYLRTYNPSGLQPVDEDVTEQDMAILAEDIGGRLEQFRYVSIWRPDDYVHAIVTKGDGFSPHGQDLRRVEPASQRGERVRRQLQYTVAVDSSLVANLSGPTTCVISPGSPAYSETFIRAHIERLPTTVCALSGSSVSTFRAASGELIVPPSVLRRCFYWPVRRRVLNLDWERFQDKLFADFLRTNTVNVILAEYGMTATRVMNACRQADIPLIAHFHGYDAYRSDILTDYTEKYEELFETAAALVVVSHDMRRQLLSLGAPENKLHLNPCGVDLHQFAEASPIGAPPVFLAVGRFVDKKGPLLTLLAFQRLLQQVPEARLVMIGDGPLLDGSKQLVRAMGFAHAVEFQGVQPHYEVAAAMRSARAFVQHSLRPSDGDSEGTPVAVLEASASGLPVISTRHAGIPDVVIEGQTGILVDEGDVEGMAQAMIRLAQDPHLAAQMGKAGRKRIEEHFSMEKSIGNLWSIIESVIMRSTSKYA